ncbi:MAG: hypothetical protein ABIO44_03255 [Saprospiraceae bacterium]
MKVALYILIILLTLVSCKQNKTYEVKNSKGFVVRRVTLQGDTTQGKNGIYEIFDEKGLPLEYAEYRNGKLEGEKRIYDAGKLYNTEFHKNDLYEGPYKVFYSDGKVQLESQYVNNEMMGELKAYYPSGKLKEIVQMKANQEDGPFKEFYENGNIRAEGNYKEGAKENGLLVLYDSLGTMIRKMQCIDGICNTIWIADSLTTVKLN